MEKTRLTECVRENEKEKVCVYIRAGVCVCGECVWITEKGRSEVSV